MMDLSYLFRSAAAYLKRNGPRAGINFFHTLGALISISQAGYRVLHLKRNGPRAGINCTESLKMTIDRGLSQIWKRAGINCTESSGGIPTSGSVGATPATQRPLHPDCACTAVVLLLSCYCTAIVLQRGRNFFHTLDALISIHRDSA